MYFHSTNKMDGWMDKCDALLVSTWMGGHLWAGKPSMYVTGHLSQLSIPSVLGS